MHDYVIVQKERLLDDDLLKLLTLSEIIDDKVKHMSFWSRYNIQTSIFAQQLQKLLIGHTFHW